MRELRGEQIATKISTSGLSCVPFALHSIAEQANNGKRIKIIWEPRTSEYLRCEMRKISTKFSAKMLHQGQLPMHWCNWPAKGHIASSEPVGTGRPKRSIIVSDFGLWCQDIQGASRGTAPGKRKSSNLPSSLAL